MSGTSIQKSYDVSTASEPAELVSHKELDEWCASIERLKDPLVGAGYWASTFFGLAAGAALALVATIASDRQEGTSVPTWLYIAYTAIVVPALLMMAFCMWVNNRMTRHTKGDADHLSGRIRARKSGVE